MDDYGRRLDHLMDLQELWSTGLAIARRAKDSESYQSEAEIKTEAELEICLKYLGAHMEKDFLESRTEIARVINELPKDATDIT